jgi:hypothetical protein
MSVRERIEDAKLLWNAVRKEGAFVQILIAVASTARKWYPKPPKGVKPVPDGQRPRPGEYANDGNSFKTFELAGRQYVEVEDRPVFGVWLVDRDDWESTFRRDQADKPAIVKAPAR